MDANPTTPPPHDADRVRPGHALRPDNRSFDSDQEEEDVTVREAWRICQGDIALEAREPKGNTLAQQVEDILGHTVRPIYAFLGNLHPQLGKAGLILSRDWMERSPPQVSRCDTGGLLGRVGDFAVRKDAAEPDADVRKISTPEGMEVEEWLTIFRNELTDSYPKGASDYVRDKQPNVSEWGDDPRTACVEDCISNKRNGDRRLWTWEIRIDDSPTKEEIVALVLSPFAARALGDLRDEFGELPRHVDLIISEEGPGCPHWFKNPKALRLLEGEDA